MQIEQFKETGAIYLDKIQDGFDRCDWEELTLPAGKALGRLLEEWRHCGEENAWADFYSQGGKRKDPEYALSRGTGLSSEAGKKG